MNYQNFVAHFDRVGVPVTLTYCAEIGTVEWQIDDLPRVAVTMPPITWDPDSVRKLIVPHLNFPTEDNKPSDEVTLSKSEVVWLDEFCQGLSDDFVDFVQFSVGCILKSQQYIGAFGLVGRSGRLDELLENYDSKGSNLSFDGLGVLGPFAAAAISKLKIDSTDSVKFIARHMVNSRILYRFSRGRPRKIGRDFVIASVIRRLDLLIKQLSKSGRKCAGVWGVSYPQAGYALVNDFVLNSLETLIPLVSTLVKLDPAKDPLMKAIGLDMGVLTFHKEAPLESHTEVIRKVRGKLVQRGACL